MSPSQGFDLPIGGWLSLSITVCSLAVINATWEGRGSLMGGTQPWKVEDVFNLNAFNSNWAWIAVRKGAVYDQCKRS